MHFTCFYMSFRILHHRDFLINVGEINIKIDVIFASCVFTDLEVYVKFEMIISFM
jgi:hypothetical protein